LKVYIVTHGYYSDQSIAGVFSSEEKANQFIQDALDRGLADYEHSQYNDFEVDKATIEWFEPGIKNYEDAHKEIIKLY
jgi:hypothetical protein